MNDILPQITNTDDEPLTIEALKGCMPTRQKHNITPSLVNELNKIVSEPNAREAFRQNILGFSSVLRDPNVTMPHYINAVKYVSFKMMGDTNQEAWIKTFPQRHARALKEKRSADYIRAVVSNYNRNKIVQTVEEQTITPTWVLNHDIYQKAINEQFSIMINSTISPMARTAAANSLLTHLKQPEVTKMTLDVNVTQDDSIRELREAAKELVKAQKNNLELGATADDIAKSKIIQGECEVVKVDKGVE